MVAVMLCPYSMIANLFTKIAIALSKSIQIGEPDHQIELVKASGWGTLTDIWVGANHQGNIWQYRCYERLCQLLTTAEIQAAKSATATAYQTSFEVIRAALTRAIAN
ncbi:hypothetical protein [Pseudanabaena cinerea]|uniref:hypothetical protein n=1 Tax=Pseudanabaena cinerea TaxID=2661616 RepID=UPI001F550536|nr:hypothetical protein [Pseudanabaena cinerea]